ncbi:uncharacterized protein N7484_000669 [Penicillium longicatenatum]|uniref:uncharacterized protein n=1 Tax=Penicillium longicatenatum TaxID=1561947 RepID=UPI002546B640|nr:uncharacterized protein N7484_000669 [Penicillium longicatenatum]KAJ5661297.1 hypothetical protein N7484_000669 [Penicillium longicatenatum]
MPEPFGGARWPFIGYDPSLIRSSIVRLHSEFYVHVNRGSCQPAQYGDNRLGSSTGVKCHPQRTPHLACQGECEGIRQDLEAANPASVGTALTGPPAGPISHAFTIE